MVGVCQNKRSYHVLGFPGNLESKWQPQQVTCLLQPENEDQLKAEA